ncbi:hypothetical protein STRTUCAR8_03194, partial [Streptomyces turgidiscabies Car8]
CRPRPTPSHLDDLPDHLRVEGAGRLVEEHEGRPHGEGAGDGDALLLSSGQGGGPHGRLVGEADPRQQGVCPFACLGLRHTEDLHRGRGDVLQGREVREEVEALEDEADVAAALGDDLRPFLDQLPGAGTVAHRAAVHEDLALVHGLQMVEAPQERGLAGARRAHDDHDLTGHDVHGHAVQDAYGAEALHHVPGGHHRRSGCFHVSSLPW